MIPEVIPDARLGLDWYGAAALKTMARNRSERGREARSKLECLAIVRGELFEPSSIRRALAGLGRLGSEALALLRLRGGMMSLAGIQGQLAVWHPDLPAEAIANAPSELVGRALAFWHVPAARYAGATVHDVRRPATGNVDGALVYAPPEILDHVVVPEGLGYRSLTSLGPAESTEAEVIWQRRLMAFLRGIETRKPKVLQSGALGVRDREAIGALLGQYAEGGKGEGTSGTSRFSPVSFLRSTLGAAELLDVSGDRVLRTTEATLPFVSAPPVRQAKTLLEAWLRGGESGLPWLPHLKCDRRTGALTAVPDDEQTRAAHRFILDLLAELVIPGAWYDLADLSGAARWRDVEFLMSWRDPAPYRWSSYSYDQSRLASPAYVGITLDDARGRSRALNRRDDWELIEGAYLRAIVEGPLTWLGLVETRVESGGHVSFALTSLGARVLGVPGGTEAPLETSPPVAANTLVVQPNFDLLVYAPNDHLELLFQIDRFAERVTVDRVALYHLSQESVCTGLQLGLHVDDILRLLEGASGGPLPQNVEVSVRDWARRLEEVRWLRNAWLLEAPNAATLDGWLDEPELARTLDRRVSPTTALLVGERPADLPAWLERRGVDVRTVDAAEPLAPSVFVEDNASLSVPEADADFFLLAALGEVAERLPDEVERLPEGGSGRHYRVTPESLARARRDGRDVDALLALFEKVSRRSLPPGFVVRVKGWSKAYLPMALGPVGYFVAPDPESFRELRADPDLAPSFVEEVSPTSALVRLDALDRLRDALATRGILSRPYTLPERHLHANPNGLSSSVRDHGYVTIRQGTAQTRQALERAIAARASVFVEYRRPGERTASTILIEPLELRQRNGSLVLRAYCPTRDDFREFVLSNILGVGRVTSDE